MKKLLLFLLALSILLLACGDKTSGTLTASAPSASNGIVTTTAKYTPSTGTVLPGQVINFRWYTVGVTSKIKSAEIASSGHTDSTGSVISQYILPTIRTESLIVYVIASTGDLTNAEGWQSVEVTP